MRWPALFCRLRDALAWRVVPRWQRLFQQLIDRDSSAVPALLFLQRLLRRADPGMDRVPLQWLDTTALGSRHVLLPEEPQQSWGPQIDGVQHSEPVCAPAVVLHEFVNARVGATSSSVWLDTALIVERASGVHPQRGHYAAGFVVGHGQRTAVVRSLPVIDIERGFLLAGNGSFNYYHWLVELLPKLQHLHDRSVPLLVSEDALRIPSFAAALTLLAGQQRPLIALRKDRLYRVERLLYMNSPTLCPFNLKPGHDVQVADFVTRPSSLHYLRECLMAGIEPRPPARASRIFLARHSKRRNYNQQSIFELFQRHGFRMVFMEALSLQEQRDAVAGAEMIAGPTGAAWTNLLFARPGTRCLCWMAEGSAGFAGYSNLARHMGVDLHYITYASAARSTDQLYQMDYHLDPDKTARALARILPA